MIFSPQTMMILAFVQTTQTETTNNTQQSSSKHYANVVLGGFSESSSSKYQIFTGIIRKQFQPFFFLFYLLWCGGCRRVLYNAPNSKMRKILTVEIQQLCSPPTSYLDTNVPRLLSLLLGCVQLQLALLNMPLKVIRIPLGLPLLCADPHAAVRTRSVTPTMRCCRWVQGINQWLIPTKIGKKYVTIIFVVITCAYVLVLPKSSVSAACEYCCVCCSRHRYK